MAAPSRPNEVGFTVGAWMVALLIFFPILWISIITSPRPRGGDPGFHLIPSRLENYREVGAISRTISPFFELGDPHRSARPPRHLVSVPAAYGMAFSRQAKTKDLLMWMLSTKMMPAVAS